MVRTCSDINLSNKSTSSPTFGDGAVPTAAEITSTYMPKILKVSRNWSCITKVESSANWGMLIATVKPPFQSFWAT
jgi:hypothetical protein